MVVLPWCSGDGSWHTASPTQILGRPWVGSGFRHGLRRGDGSSAGYTWGNGGWAYFSVYTLGRDRAHIDGNGGGFTLTMRF